MSGIGGGSREADFILSEIRRRRRRAWPGRLALGLLATAQLLLAAPWLAGQSPIWAASFASPHHLTRDGAIGLVLGAAGLAVALSPRLAWFALPLVVLLLLVQGVFFVVDHSQLSVSHLFEVIHVLGLAIAAGIALFAYPVPIGRIRKVPGGRSPKASAGLSLVEPPD